MKLSALLNELIEVEHDAAAGSRAAAARLQNLECRRHARKITESHARHVAELSSLVRSMGTAAWTMGDQCLIFSKATVIFAQRGGDQAILRALRDCERGILAAYALLLLRPLGASVRVHLEDKQGAALSHFQWLEARVEAPPPTGILLRFPTVSLEEKR